MYTLHLNNHLFEQVLFISLNLDKRKPNRNLNTLINPIRPLKWPIPKSDSLILKQNLNSEFILRNIIY